MTPSESWRALPTCSAMCRARSELIDLLGAMAEDETDPARREFLQGFPEDFGLVEEAEEVVRPAESSGHRARPGLHS